MPSDSQVEENFFSCLKLMYRLLFWTGTLSLYNTGYALETKSWYNYYTSSIRLLLLSGFFGGFIMKANDPISLSALIGRLTPVTKFILSFECLSSTITYLQVSIVMDILKQRHLCLAHSMKHMDDELKQHFPFVCWNYHKTARKYTPLTMSISCFYCIVSLVYVFILANCSCDWTTSLIIAVTYAGITISPGILGFLHVGYIDMLRIRFRLLTKLLNELRIQDATPYKRDAERTRKFRDLDIICEYVKSYTGLIMQINSVFGYASVASVFYDFAVVTNMVFLLCQKATESTATIKEFVFIGLLIVPRMYKVIMTSIYGYLTDKEKKRTVHTLQRYMHEYGLSVQSKMPTIRSNMIDNNALVSFLYWQMLNKYDLTIGTMIRCNLNVIFMIFNGIANYVIILIQLQLQQNSIKKHLISMDIDKDVEMVNKWY